MHQKAYDDLRTNYGTSVRHRQSLQTSRVSFTTPPIPKTSQNMHFFQGPWISCPNGICHVTSTCLAFAALKEDASVVTWGHRNRGGDSTEVTRLNGEGWMVASCHVDHFGIALNCCDKKIRFLMLLYITEGCFTFRY